jgi:hypothetical protein
MSDQEQWYSNKDLFEQINNLRNEMLETRNLIKQYNGLREKVDVVENEITVMKAEAKGKNKVSDGIRNWGGWIIGLISFAILLLTTFEGR